MVEVSVGTPAQKLSLLFDTGSYYTWVNPDCTKSRNPKLCGQYGRFNEKGSETFLTVHNPARLGTQSLQPTWMEAGLILPRSMTE